MALESLDTWKETFADLPKVADESWKDNWADYLAARLDDKLEFQTYGPSPGHFNFVFDKDAFKAQLNDSSAGTAVADIAAGVGAAFAASETLVNVGSYIGVQTPPLTYSLVEETMFDAPSIAQCVAEIANVDTTPVDDAEDSDYPRALRDGILKLTASISGLDSLAPNPTPLQDPFRGVE